MENKITLIIAIVNSGYSEKLMDVAVSKGARGGTIFNATGSAGSKVEVLYGITINPDKEVAMIIVPNAIANKILQAIYEELGPQTEAKAIAFTMPVDEATSNLANQYVKKTEDAKTKKD